MLGYARSLVTFLSLGKAVSVKSNKSTVSEVIEIS